jgi:hypothetical protein
MTAAVSSFSDVDSHSEVSDRIKVSSQHSHKKNVSWARSQETTTITTDTIHDHRKEISILSAVTPEAEKLKETVSSPGGVSYEIPRCDVPPTAEMDAIEKFVVNAIHSQESLSSPLNKESGNMDIPDSSHYEGYQAIISSFKRPSDPRLLVKLMIALRTAGNGSVLNQLVLGNTHAHLVHLIIRFNPTRPPHNYEDIFVGDREELLKVYQDYSLCDAHFHLLLAMVSAKSTHVLPILSATWKFLTRYGPIQDDKM